MAGYKIYYSLLLGALGGATGWFIVSSYLDGGDHLTRGAVLGACISVCASSYDSLVTGSIARIAKFAAIAALLGLVGGALALPIGQALYVTMLGTEGGSGPARVLWGVVGWAVLGTVIGASEGISKGSQLWKALLGGLAGGTLGGLFFELFGRLGIDASTAAQVEEQRYVALSLTLLGATVGASMAWVTTVLTDAWFAVVNGKLAGTVINVSKYVAARAGARGVGMIGSSSWDANIYLPGDPGIRARHAELALIDGAPTLTATPEARETGARLQVNGRDATRWPLSNNDKVLVGTTEMIYRDKRA